MIKINQLYLKNGNKMIVENYSFPIFKGEIVAIMGPNGVGKTTLLNAIIGNKKAQQGSINIQGKIGYVPQLFDMPFSYSVNDVVLMGRARYIGLTGAPNKHDFDIAHHYMQMMKVDHLSEMSFNDLSGGQKQLVMIAQALTSECEILILDEPCSALDYKNQAIVLEKIIELNKDLGLTVIYTTHMPQHALETATHALLMRGGTDYLYNSISSVLTAENLTSLYGIEVAKATFQSDLAITLAPRFKRN